MTAADDLTLFGDPAAAARDRGIRAAETRLAADQDIAVIRHAISHFADRGEPFSANDVRRLLPRVSGSLIGAGFRRAKQRGRIEAIGTVLASHAEGHRRMITLWRGTGASPSCTMPRPTQGPSSSHTPSPGNTGGAASRAPSTRETIEAKAGRLLSEGCVRIHRADPEDGLVVAAVEGTTGQHRVRRFPSGRWSCDCTAARFGQPCAHLEAVRRVTP